MQKAYFVVTMNIELLYLHREIFCVPSVQLGTTSEVGGAGFLASLSMTVPDVT